MNLTMIKTRPWLLATALLVSASMASAQDYPSKPIRFVVPFATGGLIDGIARIMADEARKSLNTTIVVENKPGAAGLIGAQMVAQLPADGYNVLFTSPATNTILPHLKAQMPFDPNVELMPLNALVSIDFVLAAHVSTPATFAEWVADAKKNPDKYSFGSSGQGTTNHLLVELLAERAGIKVLHVPYKGGGESAGGLLGGQILLLMESPKLLAPHVKAGKLHALAVRSSARLPELPDTPTLDELGYKGFGPYVWTGTFLRAGTPPAIVAKLNDAFAKALANPDVVIRLAALGATPLNVGPDKFPQMIKQDYAQWGAAISKLNLPKE